MADKPNRIEDSSKAYPKLDSVKIAEALGAEEVFAGPKTDDSGRVYCEIVSLGSGGYRSHRIYKLSEDELSTGQYRLIGEAEGTDPFHCIFIAAKHTEKFYERACGFTVSGPATKGTKIKISFYERNNQSA